MALHRYGDDAVYKKKNKYRCDDAGVHRRLEHTTSSSDDETCARGALDAAAFGGAHWTRRVQQRNWYSKVGRAKENWKIIEHNFRSTSRFSGVYRLPVARRPSAHVGTRHILTLSQTPGKLVLITIRRHVTWRYKSCFISFHFFFHFFLTLDKRIKTMSPYR